MNLKKAVRSNFDIFVSSVDNLNKVFFDEGEKIVMYWAKRNRIRDFSIFDAYFQMIGRVDRDFQEYRDKITFMDKIKKHQYVVELAFYEYTHKYESIKTFIQDNNEKVQMYELNTIRLMLIEINSINKQILKEVVTCFNSEYNDFHYAYDSVEKQLKKIKTLVSICLHIICESQYRLKSLDYSKLKKIKVSDTKVGDLILYDEFEKYKSSLARRQIKFWVNSTILHSAAFYKNNHHGEPIIYEAAGGNRKKSYVAAFEPEKGVRFIVMRPRRKLNRTETKKFQQIILENTNQKFSIIKLYGLALNYMLLKLYKKWLPFLTIGKNIYFGSGIYCSETIAIIYNEIDRNISNNEDFAMVSPIDILNSFELDIVGYIEK